MNRLLTIFTYLVIPIAGIQGQYRTVYGIVSDRESKEKLIGANVSDLFSGRGTTTDNQGVFSLSVPDNNSILVISYVGYSTDSVYLFDFSDTLRSIFLEANASINEVEVRYKSIPGAPTKLSFDEIIRIPALGGEPDVFKAFQFLPGVQSGYEGTSTLHVRGGGSGENLVLLDNVPMFYLNHLGGFVSIFNPDIINNVVLYKSGFPARFGGRLSSVLDVTMNEGGSTKMKGEASIGIIAAKTSLSGPLHKDKITYLLSARRTMFDLFSRLFFPIAVENYTMGYHFHDINGKITYRIRDNQTIHVSSYYGNDRLLFNYSDKDLKENARLINKWGNTYLSIDLKSVWSGKIRSNNQLILARYRLRNEFSSVVVQPEPQSSFLFQLSGLKNTRYLSDWTFSPFYRWTIYSGLAITHHQFVPYASSKSQPVLFSESVTDNFITLGLYIDNRIMLLDFLFAQAGLRINTCSNLYAPKVFPEPRIKFSADLSKTTSVSFSASRMIQFIHHLKSTGNIINSEYWLPVRLQLPPSVAFQYGAGIEQGFANGSIVIQTEIYYKSMKYLVEYKEGELSFLESSDWVRKLETGGIGKAYGVETLIKKNTGSFTGFLGYTFSRSYRQFTNINYGDPYPFDFDRPHDISVNLNYQFTEKISLHTAWVYKTGLPITLPIGLHETILENPDSDNEGYLYSQKNEFRMKDYHRLDVSMHLRKKKKRVNTTWSISIYNVYNRLNPYFYYLDYEVNLDDGVQTTDGPYRMKQTAFFPIIPSVNYRIEF